MITHHALVDIAAGIIPDAFVFGGTFRPNLVPENSPDRNRNLLKNSRTHARGELRRQIARHFDVRYKDIMESRADGAPHWPRGCVGSLTHKGTVILAVITPQDTLVELGVDLERVQNVFDSQLYKVVGGSAPESLDSKKGNLVAFACKEAVFKAQFPSHGRHLQFSDVTLHWADVNHDRLSGKAEIRALGIYEIEVAIHDEWVLAAAFRRTVCQET